MTKKTRKSTVEVNGNTIEAPQYKFKAEYAAWRKKVDSISSEKIASTGSKFADANRAKYPATLYGQLSHHVNKYLRDNSSNTGDDGIFEVLDAINDLLKNKEIFFTPELKVLIKFRDNIKDIEDDEKLNPRNTLFTRPSRWKRGEKLKNSKTRAKYKIDVLDDAPETIYGHYRDNYFEDKYGEPEKKGWWSTEKNTANPPLAQAIYGKGDLGITKGLLTILEEAIKEISEKAIPNIGLRVQRNAGSLAAIPSVRKQVFALLKRNDLFVGGKPKLRQMSSILQNMEFVVGEKSFGGRASPKKIITFVGKLDSLPSPIETFTLKTFGPTAMASLIMAVIGKKTYKLKNGNYLDIKGKTEVPKKEVKKSWMEQLWRD